MHLSLTNAVEMGAFRKLQANSAFPMVQRPLSQFYPDAKHFVLTVGDDSMRAAGKDGPILPGMEVLCVDMADAGLQVESGKIYATRRTPDGGQTYETIIRRAMVLRDRVELIAEGSGGALASLQSWLNEGPPGADVRAVERSELSGKPRYEGFNITWSAPRGD